MDNYSFGRCSICGKFKALKNNVCKDCEEKIHLPDCFKDIFNKKDK